MPRACLYGVPDLGGPSPDRRQGRSDFAHDRIRDAEKASQRRLPGRAGSAGADRRAQSRPCDQGSAEQQGRRPRSALVAVLAYDRLALCAGDLEPRRTAKAHKPRRKASATASACRLSPPASRSIWCRSGSATPSSRPRRSMPTLSGPRSTRSWKGCGGSKSFNFASLLAAIEGDSGSTAILIRHMRSVPRPS